MGKKFYVVFIGRRAGIYDNWPDCQAQVIRYKGNSYKGYDTVDEAISAYRKWKHDTGERDIIWASTELSEESSSSNRTTHTISNGSSPVVEAFAMGCLLGSLMACTTMAKKDDGDGEEVIKKPKSY